jgi:tetratricopeptide (TPR) repeat protein
LVFEDLGQHGQAARVLRRCRDLAYLHEDWDLYVRALHGLANHEWRMARVDDALQQYSEAFRKAKRHGLSDQIVDIAINYANALQWGKKNRQALRILQSVHSRVEIRPDAHEYYYYLGATAADANDGEVAEHAFVESMQTTLPASTRIGSADAASALAAVYQKSGTYAKSDTVLKQALRKPLPANTRASLLIQRLGMLLKARRNRPASRVFKQIQELCRSEDLKKELADAHMLIGDHEWDHGMSKEGAMKAYIAALVPAGEIGLEVMVKTGAHATQRLLTLRGDDNAQQIEGILGRMESWLRQQVGKKDTGAACRVLLWPLRIALRLARDPRVVPALTGHRMETMLQEEILGKPRRRKTLSQ